MTTTRRPDLSLEGDGSAHSGVVLSGVIDLTSSRRLTLIAEDFLRSDHANAEVDLQGVTFLNSTGLLLLVRLHRTAKARGGRVALLEPSGICLRTIEHAGLDEIFETQTQGLSVS